MSNTRSFNLLNGRCNNDRCKLSGLIDEQHKVIARTVPALYLFTFLSFLLVGPLFPGHKIDPLMVVVLIPVLAISIWRAAYWQFGRAKFASYSKQQKRRDLIYVVLASPVLVGLISMHYVYLTETGSVLNKTIVGLILMATATTSALSLSVLPVAAITVLTFVYFPISYHFITSNQPYLLDIAIMTIVLFFYSVITILKNFRAFTETVLANNRLREEIVSSKRANNAVERLALHDALTDLPNKRCFNKILLEQAKNTTSHGIGFAVGIIDIDAFKSIKDVYGEITSRSLMRQAAERLLMMMQGRGAVARIGEDIFAIIVPEVGNVRQAEEIGQEVKAIMDKDFIVGENTIPVTVCSGFAIHPHSDHNPYLVPGRAKLALKDAQSRGHGNIGVFSIALEEVQLRRSRITRSLNKAIEEKRVEPFFQPVVFAQTAEYAGFESLARWHDDRLGFISPVEFIEVAETTGQIDELTMVLLEKSVQTARLWPKNIKLFFNLSAIVLAKTNTAKRVIDILEKYDFPPERLDIELTETAMMQNMSTVKNNIMSFKIAGIGIALDDFGTGYSSLVQLQEFPIDKLKIDKSFVDKICTDKKTRNIVSTIINMCKSMDVTVVAEGIEDLEQLGALLDLGCDMCQGYLFSKPVSADKSFKRIDLSNAA